MIREQIEYTERQFHTHIVAFVSDSGGDSRKARRLLAQQRSDLIVLPCYAHQVCVASWMALSSLICHFQTYLIVGDYFKCNADILVYSSRAEQVITWLRSKTYVLARLRQIQQGADPKNTPLSVVRAVITRWTSHFLAYRRLLRLRPYIMTMILQDECQEKSHIITGTSSAKAKATEIISYLKDDQFWNAIKQ